MFTNAYGNMFSDLYTGAGDGWEINTKNEAITFSPILPPALLPNELVRNLGSINTLMSKTKNITGGRMEINAFLGNMIILTDGRLFMTSQESKERSGDTGAGWNQNSTFRKISDKFELGDSMINYDNYRNAFDSLGNDTLRDPNLEGYIFEYDFDGNRSNDFGGFCSNFSGSYPLDPSFTDAQVKTAFDSL